jgi:glycosyltransferase involved in cell wall biosynthesis
MVGRHPGYVTTQGEILTDHFRKCGYPVVSVSESVNRYVRLADIIRTIILRRRWIEVMLVQTYGGPSFVVEDVASWLARRFGHRVVFHLRGGAMPDFMARHPGWTQRVLRRGDVIITPSEFLADAIREYGFSATIIPNVIDLPGYEFRLRERIRPRLFWMRAFHPIYNPRMALRVLQLVRSREPEATLVMGGQDKGLKAVIEEEALQAGLGDVVRIAGFLDPAGKAREGAAADIYINTPNVDNTPVSVIEAWAMGLPVISTDVGGVRQLIRDGETGLLVPDDDAEAMARAVLRLIDEPGLAARLSAAGRVAAERCTWEAAHAEWQQIFARFTDGDGRPEGRR